MPERNHYLYKELESPVTLKIYTKSPEKWLLIDRETGQAYQGSDSGVWDKLTPKTKED
jgi:hypothetical protein